MERTSRLSHLVRRFVDLSFHRPYWVLLAFVLVGGVSFYLASRLVFRGSFVELLPESAREVKDLHLVSQKAGGDGYLVVQAKGAPPQVLQRFAQAVAPRLEAHSREIRYVEYRYDIGFFEDKGLLLLSAQKLASLREDLAARIRFEKQQANPLFVDLLDEAPPPTFAELERKYGSDAPQSEYLASQDGQELYLFVKPTGTAGDLEYSQRLLEVVSSTCEEVALEFPGVKTDYTGAYRIRLEEDSEMKRDLGIASMLAAALAVLLILLSTRRGAALVVVMAPVMIGIAVTFAVAQLTIGHLNVVTGFLVAILIGLGIEYGVHLSMRYWEERKLLSAQEAMVEAFGGTLVGALTSAATNAAAFLVLVFAKFHAFAQFGFIAGVGVLLTVMAAYACGPAVLAVAERIRPMKPLGDEQAQAFQTRTYRRWPTSLVLGIALAVLAFTGYSVFISSRLGFESDLRKLKGNSPATLLDDHIAQQIGVKITPAILLVKDLEQARVVTGLIAKSRERHGETTAFHKSASLNDLVPHDLENRRAEIEKLRPLLEDLPESVKSGESGKLLARFTAMLDAKPYGTAELPIELRRRFESLDGEGQFVLLFPRYPGYDTRELKLWAEQIDEVVVAAQAQGIDLHVLDGNIIASRVLELVKGDGPYILWSAALAVFLMIWVSLLSLRRALVVAIPLMLGMVCLAGGMHLFGVKLNFINVVVLPNLLAIAVDNSIHLYHRYREEGPGSLGHVLRHTGFAAVVATLSNAAGYGALLVANHQGLRSIGQLAILGVVCTFLGTTVFFPAVLALIERWTTRQPGPLAPGEVAALPMPPLASSAEPDPAKRAG